MTRTASALFSKCPICGKLPYYSEYEINYTRYYGIAFCNGTKFKKHPEISVRTSELTYNITCDKYKSFSDFCDQVIKNCTISLWNSTLDTKPVGSLPIIVQE